MRRGMPLLPTLLILLIATACAGSLAREERRSLKATISWEENIEDALALSDRDGKPVLLYFTFHG